MCQKPRELCCHQNRYRSSFAIGITPKNAWDDFIMALSGYLLAPWFSGTRPKVVGEHVLEVQSWLQTSQMSWKFRKVGLQGAATNHLVYQPCQLEAHLRGFVPTSRNTTSYTEGVNRSRGLYGGPPNLLAVKCCNPNVANDGSIPGTLNNITAILHHPECS